MVSDSGPQFARRKVPTAPANARSKKGRAGAIENPYLNKDFWFWGQISETEKVHVIGLLESEADVTLMADLSIEVFFFLLMGFAI